MSNYRFPNLKPCPLCAEVACYSVEMIFPSGNQRICVKCDWCGLRLEGNERSGKKNPADFSQEDVRQLARKWNTRNGEVPQGIEVHHIPLAGEIEICTKCEEPYCPGFCEKVKKFNRSKVKK